MSHGMKRGDERGRLAIVLTATTALAAGNVLLRWSIGEALDSGKPGAYLPAVAALLLGVSQLLLYTRQMLSAEMREDIYRRIQRKILHSSMEALGKNDLGGISARYITDVGQIDGFVDRLLGKALPDLAGWLIAVGLLFWLDLLLGIAANGAFQRWLVSFRRLHDILDLEEEPLDGRAMGFELRAESGILARGVACRPGGHSVYEDLDLELGSRGLYVMSGESGKGKTTFFRLLTGIYPYESGTLCLFGGSLREYSLKSLRSQIVYMTQEDALFQGTVRDNILWRTRADDERILALLGRLGLDRWILGLEKGLDTHVVNGGAEFSGGQRKCLLLARALLEDSAVYLLDEPFAGVDRQHSLLIWKEPDRVARNALVIAISHDQSLPEGAAEGGILLPMGRSASGSRGAVCIREAGLGGTWPRNG
jgi:ABC-type multidrug transport system fused ATPase/permease subunit